MRRQTYQVFVFVFMAGLICSSGCQEAQTPSEKQSRLIAAQNIELEKQLAARDKEIGNLKAQYSARLGLEQKKLADCKKDTANCREELKRDRSEDMDQMLIPTLNQLAELRDENVQLKAKIKELEKKLNIPEEPAKEE